MVFFAVKFFFRFEAKRKFFFATSCRYIIFLLQKTIFLRPKEPTEYFFLPMSETEKKVPSNLPTEIFPQNKPPPPFKLMDVP